MNDTPSSVRVNSYKIIHVNKCISYVWNVIIIVTMMLELSFHALYILHYYSSFRLSLYIYIYIILSTMKENVGNILCII